MPSYGRISIPEIIETINPAAPEPAELREANVFTAQESEDLYAISFETAEPNTEVTCDLYLLDDNWQTPQDGSLMQSITKTCEFGGYHRAEFDADRVRAAKGRQFAAVVTEKTKDGYDAELHYTSSGKTIEDLIRTGKASEQSDYGISVVNPKESWYQADGTWTDLAEVINSAEGTPMDFSDGKAEAEIDNCSIKVYGVPVKVSTRRKHK